MSTVGVGGFGKAKLTTYKGKKAVVKYLNVNNSPEATFATCTLNREEAKKEGEIMKLFQNKAYLAQIYAIEGHAIYMRYYEKGSLRDLIDSGGADKGRFGGAYRIVFGLKEIHRLNFVHSDLKAANILVATNKPGVDFLLCCISDFGAARIRGSMPIACTPGFYPPDYFKRPCSFKDDIYALGKVFIELFGKIKDVRNIDYKNFNTVMKPSFFTNDWNAHQLEPNNFSLELMNLVHECLNEDPRKRPDIYTFTGFFSNWLYFICTSSK